MTWPEENKQNFRIGTGNTNAGRRTVDNRSPDNNRQTIVYFNLSALSTEFNIIVGGPPCQDFSMYESN